MKKNKIPNWAKRDLRNIAIDFLISVPTSFTLFKVLESKNETIFWIYLATMFISTLIARFFSSREKESKFVQMARHVAFVSFFSLVLMNFWITILE